MQGWWRSNQALGLYILLIAGGLFLYIWAQPWTHRVMRDGFLLGLMPLIGVGFMGLCGLGMLLDPLRREIPETLEDIGWNDVWVPPAMLIGTGLCFWAMTRVGFVLAAPPFLLAAMLWFGVRPLRLAVILSVAVPVAVFAFFTTLGVRLPRGLLAGLF
jgi:hypothetical protein